MAKSNVVFVNQWSNPTPKFHNMEKKLLSLDDFIRSKFITVMNADVVFRFDGGTFSINQGWTKIESSECIVVINVRTRDVELSGSAENAYSMYCQIHCEIEELRSTL